MKQNKISKETKQLTAAVGLALRRAAKAARVRELESRHREGYERKPVKRGEFSGWESEQVWDD